MVETIGCMITVLLKKNRIEKRNPQIPPSDKAYEVFHPDDKTMEIDQKRRLVAKNEKPNPLYEQLFG
jgi:hypothetical protein